MTSTCGIFGFNWNDPSLAELFLQLLRHRGPDHAGLYASDDCTLGVQRLSIIDRAGGNQPIRSPDSELVIGYNGEVYNHAALRGQLEREGHTFRTHCDTEAVLHSYEQWGQLALDRFNGMFAFAILDPKSSKWFLARDQFGMKPLFFSLNGSKFAFSSEIKPLLHCAAYENGSLGIARYRKLTPISDTVRRYSTALVEETRRQLVESVRIRLESEVPLGTCLSGGMDSSSIVCILHNLLQSLSRVRTSAAADQSTFSAVYRQFGRDESSWVEIVARSTGVDSRKIEPSSEGLIAEIEDLIRAQEEPFSTPSVYAQWCVMRLAKQTVTVVLDGQGGDEVFCGYDAHVWHALLDALRGFRLNEVLELGWNGRTSLFSLLTHLFSRLKAQELANRIFEPPLEASGLEKRFFGSLNSQLDDDMLWELPLILRYADRNSMAFSIEARLPLLDNDLVSLALSISPRVRLHSGVRKGLLRNAMRGIVPPQILDRKDKIGYDVPEIQWLVERKKEISRRFCGEPWTSTALLGGERLAGEFQSAIESDLTAQEALLFWRLFIAGMWMRVFDLRLSTGD